MGADGMVGMAKFRRPRHTRTSRYDLSLSLSLSPDALGMISDLAFFFFMKYRKYLHLKILNGEYFSPDSFGKQTNSDEILVKSSLNSKNTLLW
jgi:hypothetical protein